MLADRNLFTAYELVQMVPLAGHDLYARMRRLNGWTAQYVPNANGSPRGVVPVGSRRRRMSRLAELALRTRLGGWLERAEWARFERKLPARTANPKEVVYSADCFKDHVDGWAERVLDAYARRVAAVGAER